jgi:hypothetical protein
VEVVRGSTFRAQNGVEGINVLTLRSIKTHGAARHPLQVPAVCVRDHHLCQHGLLHDGVSSRALRCCLNQSRPSRIVFVAHQVYKAQATALFVARIRATVCPTCQTHSGCL